MKDISILACFGIKTDELENYEIEDLTPTAISLSVKKRKMGTSCPNCGEINVRVKDYKLKHYFLEILTVMMLKFFINKEDIFVHLAGEHF